MIQVRKSNERGHADHGWLDTHHTFSFADYYDPENMGFRTLRVINEDRVQPGQGFGTHGHRDMEILSYVLEGGLAHKDSTGGGGVIKPGDVQRMSAGTGVKHSEFNPSSAEPVHLLQIWIEPQSRGLPPGYEQKHFTAAERRGRLRLIASGDGAEGSVTIHQDARLYAGMFEGVERGEIDLPAGRRAWLHLARGEVSVDGMRLQAGDGASTAGPVHLELQEGNGAELLLFDLP